ncbi:MAG TPA: methylamine dehydrogenase accessory protein MauD [Candidatus Competibacteraceae bacterium]|nr:methylamine dehydrogenase accessory protein MauD [Candidatus Competibacteraceae bacterium]
MTGLVISNVLLWLLVLLLSLVVFALTRQIGVLHARIAPAGALMIDKGAKVGDAAPSLSVQTLAGTPLTVGGPRPQGRDQLLFFLSPSCPICKELLPAVKAIARAQRTRLDLLLVSDGEPERQRELIERFGLDAGSYVLSPQVGMTYQVGKLPYAVLIDGQGIIRAKGLVNSREHLDSLFEARAQGVASLQEYLHGPDGKSAT